MWFVVAADTPANVWSALPTLMVIVFIAALVILLRDELRQLLANVSWRMKSGAAVKLFSFELAEGYVTQQIDGDESALRHHVDGQRNTSRHAEYARTRNLMLVHRVAPSKRPKMLYDVQLYFVPHKEGTLACVKHVEYYFGSAWGHAVFTSTDRAKGFPITTSAFGPFLCMATLVFTDGTKETTYRFADFEMGAIGK